MTDAEKQAAEQIAADAASGSGDDDQDDVDNETLESLRADRDKWKGISRKHEGLWKASGKKPEDLKALIEAERCLKEAEDADKTELQKATDRITTAEKLAADAGARATRYEVAAELGIHAKHLKYLTGSTREEIEESGKGILDDFPETYDPSDTDADKKKPTRPKEALRSGATPDAKTEPNQVINDMIRQAVKGST